MNEQSEDVQALSGLGRLPAEIRSMIFDLATESIGELRLVCLSFKIISSIINKMIMSGVQIVAGNGQQVAHNGQETRVLESRRI